MKWNMRGDDQNKDDTVVSIDKKKMEEKTKKMNTASEQFFPFLSRFHSKWGYDVTLKIMALYVARYIAGSATRDSDLDKFQQLVKQRVAYFVKKMKSE